MEYIILFMSKNNYDLLDNWIIRCKNISTPEIINLDLGSEEHFVKTGKEICRKHNIRFIKSERTEFQHNIRQVFNHIKSNGINYILYMHQDCFPIEDNTFHKIDKTIKNNNLSDYGFIGFNIYHDIEIELLKYKQLELMTTARTILQKGNGYYMRRPKGSRVNYKNYNKNSAYVVENVMWTSLLLSRKSFEEHIKIDLNFNFFLAADDMAFQFLKKNIYNICIPYIHFTHDQSIKTKFKLPKDSPIGDKKEVIKRYGRIDHHKIWKEKWGFEWNIKKTSKIFNNRLIKYFISRLFSEFYSGLETITRQQFKLSKNKSRLMIDLHSHDPINGPLKYIKFKQ